MSDDDTKRYFDMIQSRKSKAETLAKAMELDFVSWDNLMAIQTPVAIVMGATLALTLFTFLFLSRPGAQQRIKKLRKMTFVPTHWAGIACGIGSWLAIQSVLAIILFMKAFVDKQAGVDDVFIYGMLAITDVLIVSFAVTMGVACDVGYSVLCCVLVAAVSFFQAASVSNAVSISGYMGLASIGFAGFWGVGIGKHWFKSEMTQAMKEIEGWGIAKEMTAMLKKGAAPAKRGRRQTTTK